MININLYTLVEYIQSDAISYIDTGIKFSDDIKIFYKFSPINVNGSQYYIGARNGQYFIGLWRRCKS